jgi:hypothetical protein
MPAQIDVLHDVLGVGHRAEHAVGDAEQTIAMTIEDRECRSVRHDIDIASSDGCDCCRAGRKGNDRELLQHRTDRAYRLWDSKWPAMLPRPREHRSFTRMHHLKAGIFIEVGSQASKR